MDTTIKKLNILEKTCEDGNCANAMRLFLMSENGQLFSVFLPSAISGKYYFSNEQADSKITFVSLQAIDGKWCAVCTDNAFFQEEIINGAGIAEVIIIGQTIPLVDRMIYRIAYGGNRYTLYSEIENDESNVLHSYLISLDKEITIGRMDTNDICIDSRYRFVSRRHAKLRWENDGLHVVNWESRNGVFLNSTAINDQKVSIGDTIFIMGLRIVIGAGFIAMNDGNHRIKSLSTSVRRIGPRYCKEIGYYESLNCVSPPINLFNRTPRKRIAFNPKRITIEAPPMALTGNGMPLFLRMGSSAIMGGSAALAGNYTMLLSSVLFPFMSQKYTEKERRDYEGRRNEKYTEYLNQKKTEISEEVREEERILRENYPDISRVLSYTYQNRMHLWERRPVDDDFLTLRFGFGRQKMFGELDYPAQRFNLDSDELEDQMYALAEKKYELNNIPILVDAVKYNLIGLAGHKPDVTVLLRQLIAQITLLHSYDEVKLVLLLEPSDLIELEFVKYIPHVWDDEKTMRYIALTTNEAVAIGEQIKNSIEERLKKNTPLSEAKKAQPYYFIVATSKRLLDSMEVLKDVLKYESNCGVSMIAAMDELPKECSIQVDLFSDRSGRVVFLRDLDRSEMQFSIDACDKENLTHSMHTLANTSLKQQASAFSLPKSYSFLEMFGVGRVEHLNITKRWQDNNPVLSLSVPVGISTDGSSFNLDLHQKCQGPHGLVAGMTGSGKSEFLITYILSLAVNFHPDEVAFVLIDYKGGGLAGAFDDEGRGIHLPHLIATITNLDGATIQRSLISVESELKRRQLVLNEARSLTDEGTLDIYSYQRMYRNKQVSKPMPHLFIICDEFAELKQQQPEFMDQLISIARIGRSLGVHLILATQKPAGVVNEQIRSNTKFRVCLKVQDKADSMDMLERTEAASLRETGRFYLQVGYNELFALGQSAWSGAPYVPQDSVVFQKDDSVQFIDSTGQSILTVKPQRDKSEAKGSQLIETVRLLTKIASEQGIKPRSLWRPELPKKLALTDITEDISVKSNHVTACVGYVDNPQEQTQFPLVFDFTSCGNLLIVGEAGSGKTTLLHTIIRQIVHSFSPEAFQFYALDYSSRMLPQLKGLPHCGGVLLEEDSSSLSHFFKLIQNVISQRKKVFMSAGLDDFTAVSQTHSLPLIVVFIDNLSGLSSSKEGEQISYKLHSYLKEGQKYGVKFVITESHINNVPSKIKQEATERLALHMRDKYEYSDVLNEKVSYCPTEIPGRGLCVVSGKCLEFQAPVFVSSQLTPEGNKDMLTEVAALTQKYAGLQQAQKLPVLDLNAEYEDFCGQFTKGRLPLGFSTATKRSVSLPYKQFSTLGIYWGRSASQKHIFKNLLFGLLKEKPEMTVLKRKVASQIDSDIELKAMLVDANAKIMETTEQSISDLWPSLSDEFTHRKEMHISFCKEKQLDPSDVKNNRVSFQHLRSMTKPLVIVLESYSDFCVATDFLSRMVFAEFFALAEKCNIYFICCFEPDDCMDLKSNPLLIGFNEDGPCLLFGGQYSRQVICHVPESVDGDAELPYNLGLMRYHGDLHPLIMPCGKVEEEHVDEDDKNIFDG